MSDKANEAILHEAIRHPVLDRDEEIELARRAGAGDGDAARRLVGSHLRFVIKLARRYRGLGVPMSDLVQDGIVGLLHAIRKFDPRHGTRLSTYAMWWIRASLQDSVVRSWSIVRGGTSNVQKAITLQLRRTSARLDEEALSDDVIGRIARRIGAGSAEARMLARRLVGTDASIDAAPRGGPPLVESLACEAPTPEQRVAAVSEQRFVRQAVMAALEHLPARERFVIRKRYFEEVRPTFAAIGRELGVSKDRVRQLEGRALERLRSLLRAQEPDAG